jgi:phage-related protein
LVIATGSVQKAMQLQTLALDVSAGSGKSLEAVTQALAKAQEGNTTSLGRLGVGLTAAQLKTMSMDDVTKSLAKTFAGAADTAANTFEGKINRLNLAFEDVRDSVGGFVLDAITPMVENIVTKVMPALATFADGLGKSLGPAFNSIGKVIRDDVLPIIKAWYGFIVDVIIPGITAIVRPVFQGLVSAFNSIKNAVSANSDELKPLLNLFKSIAEFVRDDLAPILGGAFKLALQTIGTIVAGLVTGFSRLVGFITQTITKIKEFVNFVKDNPVTRFFFGDSNDKSLKAGGLLDQPREPITPPTFLPTGPTGLGGAPVIVTSKFGGTRDISGLSLAQQAAVLRSIELQAETQRLRDARAGITPKESNIIVNVNGAIDPEGTARTIVDTLNNSFYRGTGGANSLQIA